MIHSHQSDGARHAAHESDRSDSSIKGGFENALENFFDGIYMSATLRIDVFSVQTSSCADPARCSVTGKPSPHALVVRW